MKRQREGNDEHDASRKGPRGKSWEELASGNDVIVNTHEICLKYLPYETTEQALKDFFAECGEMQGQPTIMKNPSTGMCKGMGWIKFVTEQACKEALSWNGCKFMGRNLSITPGISRAGGVTGTTQSIGTHTPALFEEVLSRLVLPNPHGVYVDGTFGRGGHTRGILNRLSPQGRLHAFDIDDEAIAAAKELEKEDPRFTIHKSFFGDMAKVLAAAGVKPDGVLLDIGISSPQLDGDRGFRPEMDGIMDLRFDLSKGVPAWKFLETVELSDLERILVECGGEDATVARRIASMVVLKRQSDGLPKRTSEFAEFVRQVKGKEYQLMHPAKLAFQALRIHLNLEFAELRRGMHSALHALQEGGRLGIITWKHSECAIVMEAFRQHERCPLDYPLLQMYKQKVSTPSIKAKKAWEMEDPSRPSAAELKMNSRARSALLHVFRKEKGIRVVDLEQVAYLALGIST